MAEKEEYSVDFPVGEQMEKGGIYFGDDLNTNKKSVKVPQILSFIEETKQSLTTLGLELGILDESDSLPKENK